MKKIPVEEAIGMVLAHDMTKIVVNEFKGVAFKKGHIIAPEDVEELKNMGKNHIFTFELGDNHLHENDGAQRVAKAVAGDNISLSVAIEGKVNLSSRIDGRLTISLSGLDYVNEIEGVILATRHRDTVVKKGDLIAGAKIIPLVIEKEQIIQLEAYDVAFGKIMNVVPFVPLKVGILVTGSEVFSGRIVDAFAPVLERKAAGFGGKVMEKRFVPDEIDLIKSNILELLELGCQCIMVSGGMSVDPDDLTPTAIREIATEVISYGSPVLPGAMFMMSYYNDIPILGVPACGMFNKTTVLDLILPYVFTQEKVTQKLMIRKAHGGLCLKCDVCIYPHCEFGKG